MGRAKDPFALFVAVDARTRKLVEDARDAARTDATVLMVGPTGGGETMLARMIHDASSRANRPFVRVDLAGTKPEFMQSEIFGHVRGAFTGATTSRKGAIRVADGGTLFLDEVGELPQEGQAKLLTVLAEREYKPLGSDETLTADVRVIVATNRDLRELVDRGEFREDLYYRLAVLCLEVPGLAERPDDIVPLFERRLREVAPKGGRHVPEVEAAARRFLAEYLWPGNVRELRNAVERWLVSGQTRITRDVIVRVVTEARGPTGTRASQLGSVAASPSEVSVTVDSAGRPILVVPAGLPWKETRNRVESAYWRHVLEAAGWNRKRAAEIAQVDRRTLYNIVRKHFADRPPDK